MANGNFGGGTGVLGDPYLVEDAQDLNAVRNNLTAHYEQTANIDIFATYPNWVPIGNTYTNSFKGVYDGANYEIQNLTITARTVGISYTSLFSWVGHADMVLKNIKLMNVNITDPTDWSGPLVGWQDAGLVTNCFVSGDVTCPDAGIYRRGISGTIGSVGAGAVVSYCVGTTTVLIQSYYGDDFVGFTASNDGTIYRCAYIGNVNGYRGRTAGFTAYNDGTIDESYVIGTATSTSQVGGFARDNSGTIRNSFFKGTIVGNPPEHLSAFITYNNGTVINCYTAAIIPDDVGLIRTKGTNSVVAGCYKDSDLSGDTYEGDGSWGWPRTTLEMTYPYDDLTTFLTWDFSTIWDINAVDNDAYPFLPWRIISAINLYVKSSGVYKKATNIYEKQLGVYKKATKLKVKDSGNVWK